MNIGKAAKEANIHMGMNTQLFMGMNTQLVFIGVRCSLQNLKLENLRIFFLSL